MKKVLREIEAEEEKVETKEEKKTFRKKKVTKEERNILKFLTHSMEFASSYFSPLESESIDIDPTTVDEFLPSLSRRMFFYLLSHIYLVT